MEQSLEQLSSELAQIWGGYGDNIVVALVTLGLGVFLTIIFVNPYLEGRADRQRHGFRLAFAIRSYNMVAPRFSRLAEWLGCPTSVVGKKKAPRWIEEVMGRGRESAVLSWLEREGARVPSDSPIPHHLPTGEMLQLVDAYESDLDVLIGEANSLQFLLEKDAGIMLVFWRLKKIFEVARPTLKGYDELRADIETQALVTANVRNVLTAMAQETVHALKLTRAIVDRYPNIQPRFR
ncbi:MAG: hypothetical protein ACE5IA_01310 [Dehalococcoidia bacterium]